MKNKIISVLKENLLVVTIVFIVFLISLFSGALAMPLYRQGIVFVAVLMWILYSLSVVGLFISTRFIHLPVDFSKNPSTFKFYFYLLLVVADFVIFTIVFVIFRFAVPSSFINFLHFNSILLTLTSTLLLGLFVFLIK